MIRVFRAAPMLWFKDNLPEEFKRVGLQYVDGPGEADIILGPTVGKLQNLGDHRKRFAVWTGEPRWDLHCKPVVKVAKINRPVHIMNVHTGRIYQDNYLFFDQRRYPGIDRDEIMRAFVAKPARAVMLATFHPRPDRYRWYFKTYGWWQNRRTSLATTSRGELMRDGQNIDLFQGRQDLAVDLYRRGFCDIYGRRWPTDVRIAGESRKNEWTLSKRAILENYRLNIAFENTIVPHYVTEKIWDAISGACLPVYHGAGNRIYDDFPAGSFIEAGGKTIAALAQEIRTIGPGEAADRFEVCLDTYLRIVREGRHKDSVRACYARTAAFLQEVMDAAE
jgi:hypothetical protein